ncbi:MAG: basic amino acid ABC transporter substrate-binding protein [Succinivibrio sp.]|nr:basic amino acid ABC transporter substrate-binding protein [Succinivibrio sp.]
MRSMKKAAAAALGAALMALSSFASAETVRFATEPTFPPFEFQDSKDGAIIGFDVDLITAIGKQEGFEAEMVAMPFDAVLASVISGTVEASITGLVKNAERAKRVDFSDGYYTAGQSMMIRKEDQAKYHKLDDLKGQKVCVQIGSVGLDLVKKIEGAEPMVFNSMPEAYMELDRKGCVAAVTGNPVNSYYLVTTKNDKLMHVEESMVNAADLGIITQKGNTKLMARINDGLKKIKDSGEYQQIYDKWFKAK